MDKNFIFAILLTTVIVVFFSSPLYQKKFGKETPVPQQTQTLKKSESQSGQSSPTQIDKPALTSTDSTPQTITEASKPIQSSDSTSVTALPPNTQIDKPLNAENIVLTNDNMTVTVLTAGGNITNVTMSKYTGPEKNTTPQLVTEGQSWYGGYIVDEDKEILLKDIIFNILDKSDNKITLLATLADGRTITRVLSLENNSYYLNTETNLAGPWKNPVIHYSFYGPINITEKKINKLMIWPFSMFAGNNGSFNKAVFLGQGDRLTIDRNGKEKNKRVYTNEGSQKIVSDKNKSGKEHFEGDLSWFAVRNKYFMNASIPVEKSLWNVETVYTFDGENSWYDYDISKKLADGNPNIKIYMGPVSFDALTQAGNELTQIMEFSWSFIRPISIAFLWVVKQLHNFISNWGLVLILFSLLVKLALAPLSHKSFVSMQKMASLQPQIAELRDKHKSNPQKLQQATMELYKKEGVNPFGGCLPVLLQMPVFFALYPVIDTSFELRQAMFIPNWISDLSRPDPFYILPIAMGLSMYFQSKTTMSKDPNQKMMLYIMPVMMVILFANFSAGLTLYWLMFNIFSFIQQELVKPKMTPSRT